MRAPRLSVSGNRKAAGTGKTNRSAPAGRGGSHLTHQSTRPAVEIRSPGDVLDLQRDAGNRATTALLLEASGDPGPVVQRVLSRGSGWGWPRWVTNTAAQLWADLDRKFNTELVTLKSDLETLRTNNSFATDSLNAVITEIDDVKRLHDGAVNYPNADALNKILDTLIAKVGTTKTAVGDGRRDRLAAFKTRLGTPLTSMAIDFAGTKLDPQDRKNLIAELSGYETNSALALDTTAIEASVARIELAYKSARDKTVGLKAKKAKEQELLKAEEERQAALDRAERDREAAVKASIVKVIPSYGLILAKCDSIAQLAELATFIKKGEDTLLNNCLSLATATQVLALFKVHNTGVAVLNKLIIAAGDERIAGLKGLLQEVESGEEAELHKILKDYESPAEDLLALLKLMVPAIVYRFLEQGTSAELVDLFVTRGVVVQPAIDLLKSTAGHHAVPMLTSVPNSEFLMKMHGLAPDPEELFWVVTDLPKNSKALSAAKAMAFKKSPPATWADIKDIRLVQEARGLRTDSGAVIDMVAISSLTEHQQTHVKACLAGIAKGEAPTLTHPDGAKFGDNFDNAQGRLPGVRGAGGYKEYYVEKNPTSAEYHGQRRIVVSNTTGFAYLTLDHYDTFQRII